MKRLTHPLLTALCCAAALGLGLNARAQDTPPATQPDPVENNAGDNAAAPEGQSPDGLVVHDLVVMLADLYGDTMNDAGDFNTTLFNGAPRRRPVGEAGDGTPMPLGLITFHGALAEPTAMRLDLAPDDGRFLGHWPKGIAASDYLLWQDIRQVETPQGRWRIPSDHWLATIRDTPGPLCFDSRGQVDRFFAYDPTFPFSPTLTVEGKREDGYTLAGEASADTRLALVVRRGEDGWQAGSLTAAPFTGPIELTQAGNADAAMRPVLDHLRDAGYSDTEVETAAAMLAESAFGDASMSLIYVVGNAAMDAMLPLTILPAPAKVIRTGIVVVNNVEPDIAGTVGGLIVQLGDDEWARRDAAQRALVEMDRAAIGVVREHVGHADPEVAYRIEQIIAIYDARHE